MASTFAKAARRLSQSSIRGLGDALSDAGAASSSGRQLAGVQQRQPWALSALRAHAGSSGEAGSEAPPAQAGPATALGGVSAGTSSRASSSQAAAEAAAAAAAAAPRTRAPPGHADFQQRQLLMIFTCSKCNTRAAKAFSKQAYEGGVVIVDCPGCHSKHLIADHLGWFGQKGTVEEFAAERGSTLVKKLMDGTVELTPEDLLGSSLVAEAEAAAAGAPGGSGSSEAAASGGSGGA